MGRSLGTPKGLRSEHESETLELGHKQLLSAILRLISDAVISTDAEGKITLVNRAAEALTGWTEEEAVGRYVTDVVHLLEEEIRVPCANPVEDILKTGKALDFTNCKIIIDRGGVERIVIYARAPVRDGEGNIAGVVLVLSDVTEKREMTEEVLKLQKLESIGTLAGGIAHDFNNILTAIMGNISLARIYAKPGDKASERLAEAEKASMQAKGLTQQLLAFSRKGAPILMAASAAESLKESASFVLRGSNVRCEFSIPDDLWPLEISEVQINQVTGNLIINADQAMPEGGIIEVGAENVVLTAGNSLPLEPGKYVKISVKDHGVGIPEEHIHKIFDPNFTTKQKGTGLGLAISRLIVKDHGGHIAVESAIGIGTTVSVYLPAYVGQNLARNESKEKLIMGAGKILIMDDEQIVRDLAREMLNRMGYEVKAARSSDESIELYKRAKERGRPFDVVIMDLTVPGEMGGRKAIGQLIEIDPAVKVIVSSGYSNDPIMSDFSNYGFCRAIAKPYKIKELSRILHEVINGVKRCA
jgi:PAS domain S-box-containing protein